jgi:hypothetical protein
VRLTLRDIAAYAMTIAILLAPWAIVVQMNEGLPDYVRTRAALFEEPARAVVYASLLDPSPLRRALSSQHAAWWLHQTALLAPLLLLMSGTVAALRSRSRSQPVPPDAARMVVAGLFLVVIDSVLFRESSYVVIVAPLTAALGARLFTARTHAGRACAIAVLLLTGSAAVVWAREATLFRPSAYTTVLPNAFTRLLAPSPEYEDDWRFGYARDCTDPGDRVLVTGMTPFHVSYFAQRPIAGGHLYWRSGWRADPAHEAQSLALLQRQSVPYAISTRNPVLDDFEKYPKIREYLVKHYVVLEGSNGLVLVDSRRQPTGRVGPKGLPCFR